MENITCDECCLHESGKCGPYTRKRNVDQTGIAGMDDLINNTKPHLVRLKLLRINDVYRISEQTLIESRMGRVFGINEKICPYHRFTLGIEWRQPLACMHHDHPKGKAYTLRL